MSPNVHGASQYGLMAGKTCQIKLLSFFHRATDQLMETTMWIQKQFQFSKLFGLVSQDVLIQT